jgi:competence protein ComGC
MNFRITHINPTMNSNLKNSKDRAFTRIELAAIIAILALLTLILLPALAQDSQNSARRQCVNNLKQVGLAFKTWAVDNGDKFPMAVSNRLGGTLEFAVDGNAFRHFQVMSNELTTPKILVCPADTRKPRSQVEGQPAQVFGDLQNKNISYFVGLDASDSKPMMFLSGDRNITNGVSPVRTVLKLRPKIPAGWTETMHVNQGNVGIADGSVQQYSSARLQQALQYTEDSTNRIALPE